MVIAVFVKSPAILLVLLLGGIPAIPLLVSSFLASFWKSTNACIVLNVAAVVYAGFFSYFYCLGFILSPEPFAPPFFIFQFVILGAPCMIVVWGIACVTNLFSKIDVLEVDVG